MRKIGITAFIAAALVISMATGAIAANPHFIGTPTATQSGTTVTVSFKAAGLGNVDEANFTLSGTLTISSRCYTKSGNTPQAANKQEEIFVTSSGTFPVSNGQTTGSLSVSGSSTLSCPGGQRVVIEDVSYNLTLSGEGLSTSFSG